MKLWFQSGRGEQYSWFTVYTYYADVTNCASTNSKR